MTIEGHGSLLPEERHKIYAPVAGIVGEVLVDHDARVKKGDILAKLDSYELQKELKGLMADMQKAESQIVSLGLQSEKLRRGQDEQEQSRFRPSWPRRRSRPRAPRSGSRSSTSRSSR